MTSEVNMSMNPSCNNVQGELLPRLGDQPFSAEALEIAKAEILGVLSEAKLDIQVSTRKEFKKGSQGYQLARMGVSVYYEGQERDLEEVRVYGLKAKCHGWSFYRAWYYWICTTENQPIDKAAATELNKEWREQIRVRGFAGGHDVDDPVFSYHVDTLVGLLRLVDEIRWQGAKADRPTCAEQRADSALRAWASIRPTVRDFALQMERVLRRNDHKGGWLNSELGRLYNRMVEEVQEVDDELHRVPQRPHAIAEEAVDVANFAMMLWDRTCPPDRRPG